VIKYEPSKLIKKIAPEKKIKKLVGSKFTLKKAALSFVDDLEVVSKKSVTKVALKPLKAYRERIKDDPELKGELKAEPRQLIQRVQNEVLMQVTEGIKEKYEGEFYKWLPSDADEPDPQHALRYGSVFQIGVGEMPGERIGCRCGMEILVDDTKLEI
jgi:hypothetical protein